ncbi:membrane protein [Streptomyces sp. MUSC 125]|uniref:membrane protein n=1 Tax=Streptomyces sp. MUSC 125 TaxID=1428624 RepID=UPI00057FD89F|nr:membrane protein [Streptomyces sp. MUSC 125]KIE27770.1 membrane protein [Streptomyces sp. MUSC 125]
MTGMGMEVGAQAARSRAVAVLRVRGRALGVALLPAGAAVILLTGGSTGHLVGRGWDTARWIVSVLAVLVLLAAAGIALVLARARPAVSPTVPVAEEAAPDLYRMVRDLADRLDVPAPSAIAVTPDCDSWLEDRTHAAHGPPPPPGPDETPGPGRRAHRRTPAAPVLVIGSPFLWWMRVGELRAVIAPVIAGTGPSAHPDIAAARRFVSGLDAAVAVASTPGRCLPVRGVCAVLGWVARLLLRGCREHATQMERGVAAAAAERAQTVDYGLRIVAQEQVGLAYAGWDRLLTRVALPAWRMGRWPARLDVGVVAALTELSRRDRLAENFTSRLGERPACDLLEEPGVVDEAASLLAARLFHGGPAEPGPDWAPVDWQAYPEEVVDRTWRADAARLHRVLDSLGVHASPDPTAPDSGGPTLARVLDHLTEPTSGHSVQPHQVPDGTGGSGARTGVPESASGPDPSGPDPSGLGHVSEACDASGALGVLHSCDDEDDGLGDGDDTDSGTERSAVLAAGLSAELAREEAAVPRGASAVGQSSERAEWDDGGLPLFPLQPPRTARDLLADHVTAMVCCAAVDTAGGSPALDWLDGPSLLLGGERTADLTPKVFSLIEDGDPGPLRDWLAASGIRPEKPVRLV